MTQAPHLSPEVARSVSSLARALVAASRSWALYPPEHPAVTTALERFVTAIEQAGGGGGVALGVTPETLLVAGIPLPAREGPVSEAAALLHDRDILEMSFGPRVATPVLRQLLALLNLDASERRDRGGPEKIWAETGDPAVAIRQVDYQKVLEDHETRKPAERDEVWLALVQAITSRQKTLDQAAQQRLLQIAGDAEAIGALAHDVMQPHCTPEGSPLLTTQAAAVLGAYRHLTNVVTVLAPDRMPEVMRNLASATAALDPHIVIQLMQTEEGGGSGEAGLVQGIVEAFDDVKVAQLLATTLALEGRASSRLAQVFDTIAPDAERKRRVLTLAKSLLKESDFGKLDEFQTIWSSMEELLFSYDERPFVSAGYRQTLDGIAPRASAMSGDLPPESGDWIATLGQENVRRLSVVLLVDLLHIEQDATRASALAEDMAALAEDLLLAGDYEPALEVTRALATTAREPTAVARDACRLALDKLGSAPALREAATLLDQMTDPEHAAFRTLCADIGPASVEALSAALTVEPDTAARQRATEIVLGFGVPAVSRLAPLVAMPKWYAQRNAADILGRIGAKEAVPLIQPLLRSTELRVVRAAFRAMSQIDDPSAARAVHTALRAAAGESRRAIVDALVAERDPRVVPILLTMLGASRPLGSDHALVLETIDALARVGHESAVGPIAALMGTRSWFARRKARAVKEAAVAALIRIGTAHAKTALDEAARSGDRLLRRIAAAARAG